MSDYIISCCSSADLTKAYFEKRDIRYICFHYELGGKEYPDDLGETIPFDEFYRRMQEGEDTRTSQISTGEYEEYFEGFLKEGLDILHIGLSSGLSGTVNSAKLAMDMLRDRYPERKIYVVDSLAASSGIGLLVDRLADLRDSGMSVSELYQEALALRLQVHHWFFSSDLTFFIRGGRVSKTAGFVGNLLNICPLLNVDHLGRLIPREKIRTKRRVIQRIVDVMEEHAKDGTEYSGKVFISNSACPEDAKSVAQHIRERFPKLDGDPEIFNIGGLIGAHTGPGTVAVFFWGDERTN